jgi:RNA polymerase-binding transcription factor DksA
MLTDAVITPQLSDLGIQHPTELLMAMNVWRSKALDMLGERPITASNLNDKRELLTAVAEPRQLPLYPYERNGHEWPLTATELWQLISGPYNPEGATVQKIFSWLSSDNRETSNLLSTHLQELSRVLNTAVAAVGNNNAEQVATLEQNISSIGELKVAHIMFGQLGSLLYAELLEAEDRLNEALINTLHQAITAGTYGTCRNCGSHCSPWFNYCEPCFQSR